jgi:hypothetical protein
MLLKSNIENEIIENTKKEVERKHMLIDCDRVLAELKHDREKREAETRKKKEVEQLRDIQLKDK